MDVYMQEPAIYVIILTSIDMYTKRIVIVGSEVLLIIDAKISSNEEWGFITSHYQFDQ